jgi:hypothetical protein
MAERGEEKIEGGSYKRFHGHPISNQGGEDEATKA